MGLILRMAPRRILKGTGSRGEQAYGHKAVETLFLEVHNSEEGMKGENWSPFGPPFVRAQDPL